MNFFQKPSFSDEKAEKIILGVLWAVTAFLVVKTFLIAMFDPDFWWHLAMGREMVEKHIFLRSETFSHTMQGEPWINFEWLSQVLAYLIYKTGGLSALYWTKVVICLAVMGALIGLMRSLGLRGPWLLTLTWIGFLVLRPRLFERAELITLLLLPLFIALILKIRQISERTAKFFPLVFFILMVIWTNAHGGFTYGIALVASFCLGFRWSREPALVIRVLDRCLMFSLLAIFITPFGWSIGALLAELTTGFIHYKNYIQEWMAPDVIVTPYFWFLYILMLAGLGYVLYTKKNNLLRYLPSILLFSLWGASSYRNTALLVFPALAFLSEIILQVQVRAGSQKKLSLLLTLFLIFLHWPKFQGFFPRQYFTETYAPSRAVNFIRQSRLQGTLYNGYEFGGYLDWVMGPGPNIFADGRYPFFPIVQNEIALQETLSKKFSLSLWSSFYDKWKIDYALVSYPLQKIHLTDSAGPRELSTLSVRFPRSNWALLYWDDVALVFVKRIPKFEPIILSREYRVARPYSLEQMKYLLESGLVSSLELASELNRHESEVGLSRKAIELREVLDSFNSKGAPTASAPKTPK